MLLVTESEESLPMNGKKLDKTLMKWESNEGGEGERTVLCGSWGQEVGVSGGEVFVDENKWEWKDG